MTAAFPNPGCTPGHKHPPLQTQDPTETSDTGNAPGSTRNIFSIGNGPRTPDLVGDERGTLKGAQISGLVATLRTKRRMGFKQVTCTLHCPNHSSVHKPAHTHISGAQQVVGEQGLGEQLGLVRTFSDQGSEGLACNRWLPINLSGGSRCTALGWSSPPGTEGPLSL